MQEKLLHTIWQYSLLNLRGLKTTQGENVTILHTGVPNTHQGADFVNAKIRVGDLTWMGNIEIDMRTSLWNEHQHHKSPHFDNVILHLVWENDKQTAPHQIPIVELKHLVSPFFLNAYLKSVETPSSTSIPCQSLLADIPSSLWETWKTTLLYERLRNKVAQFLTTLNDYAGDWDQACWVWLAKYVGGKQNADAFVAIATHIPIVALYKEKQHLIHVEALLLGVSGILDRCTKDDEYSAHLKTLYAHLALKYTLKSVSIPLSYLRMRPYQFPDLRLAQLAHLVFAMPRMSDLISDRNHMKTLLSPSRQDHTSTYWTTHFRLAKETHAQSHHLGQQFKQTLIINALLIAMLAYQQTQGENDLDQALAYLESLPLENNAYTKYWKNLASYPLRHATDSQALLHLTEHYCQKKRCLECAFGHYLLYTKNEFPPQERPDNKPA